MGILGIFIANCELLLLVSQKPIEYILQEIFYHLIIIKLIF